MKKIHTLIIFAIIAFAGIGLTGCDLFNLQVFTLDIEVVNEWETSAEVPYTSSYGATPYNIHLNMNAIFTSMNITVTEVGGNDEEIGQESGFELGYKESKKFSFETNSSLFTDKKVKADLKITIGGAVIERSGYDRNNNRVSNTGVSSKRETICELNDITIDSNKNMKLTLKYDANSESLTSCSES